MKMIANLKKMSYPIILFSFLIPLWVGAQTLSSDSLLNLPDAPKGSSRIGLLCRLASENFDENPQLSLKYADEALRLALESGNEISVSDALKIKGDALYYLDSIQPASFAYLQALDAEELLANPRPEKMIYRFADVGFCYQDMGLFDKSIEYYERALSIARAIGDTLEIATNLSNIAISLKMLGKYGEAIEAFNQTLELDKLQGNDANLAIDYNNIGAVYQAWREYSLAIEFFGKALEIDLRQGNRHKLSIRYSNIAQVYLAWDSVAEAINYFYKALEIDREMNASVKIATRMQGLGMSYLAAKDYNKAIRHLKEAQKTFETLHYDFKTAHVLAVIGQAYMALNDQVKAEDYYRQSLTLSQQLNLKPTIAEAAKGLYVLYKNQGSFKKSLTYYEIYNVAEDSIFSEASARQVNEFEIRYETEKKENENRLLTKDVQLLTKDIEIKIRNQWLMGTLIVALIFVSLALFYAFSMKRKSLLQSKVLFEKESELSNLKIDQAEKRNRHLQEVLFAEKEIKRLQAESIEQKNHELTSATILIANKNEVLDNLAKLADKMNCENGQGHPEIKREMLREIERQTDVENQWEQFKVHFESIHKSFFATLRENNPALTQPDLQLCAYIKLNMATKEIARLMNIAPESVNTHRYRLRKKLNLPAEETLDGFIHTL
jgi:tetratricopeptide (TPR) repeat protein